MRNWLMIVPLAMGLYACSSDEPADKTTPTEPDEEVTSIPAKILQLSRAEQNVIENQTGFAFNLFNEVMNDKNNNVVIAPQSLATLLAMMANGADGSTLAELTALFGLQPNQLEVLNNLNKMLVKELPALDNNVTVTSANSLWVDPSFPIYDSFKEVLKNTYNAEYFAQALDTWDGVNKFNKWCETNTDGMIKNFLDSPMPSDVAIANANYFNGNWSDKFDKANTKPEDFTNESGSKTQVMMMHAKDLQYNYYETESLHAVRIPYGNTNYAMTVILSKNTDKLPVVTSADWKTLRNYIVGAHLDLSLPKFELNFKDNINSMLANIGLSETLSNNSDFSKLSSKKTTHKIIHGAKIEVDEQGTKGSGISLDQDVTLGGGGNGAKPMYVNFEVNKPFLFVIEEVSTHTIMYMGAVRSLN